MQPLTWEARGRPVGGQWQGVGEDPAFLRIPASLGGALRFDSGTNSRGRELQGFGTGRDWNRSRLLRAAVYRSSLKRAGIEVGCGMKVDNSASGLRFLRPRVPVAGRRSGHGRMAGCSFRAVHFVSRHNDQLLSQ